MDIVLDGVNKRLSRDGIGFGFVQGPSGAGYGVLVRVDWDVVSDDDY
jgi:hypothetical protein